MKQKIVLLIGSIVLISLFSTGSYGSDRRMSYEVTITNITGGQTFTPFIIITHKKGVKLFTPGEPARKELAQLAEGGDTGPLAERMMSNPKVGQVITTDGLLGPGETIRVKVPAERRFRHLSVAAMLLPTNDGFVALNSVHLPISTNDRMYLPVAYDAGSEINDELCENIPGGDDCSGAGYDEEDGEGYVHIHGGIHGIGDLHAADYDWRNPVARIIVKKVR